MNLPPCYLLVCAKNLDDVPVGIYQTEKQARAAITPGVQPKVNPLEACDTSGPVCWKVVRWAGGKWSKPKYFDFDTGKANRVRTVA